MRKLPSTSSFKRTLLCLVVALILFNVLVFTLVPDFAFSSVLKYIVYRDKHADSASACPKMSIQRADYPELTQENPACLPHIQTKKACRYTAKAYAPYPSLLECPDLPYELCTVSETKSLEASLTSLKINCDMSLCDLYKPMYIEAMDPGDGTMKKYDIPKGASDKLVEDLLLKYAEISRQADLNFLFLNCTGLYTRVKISQLLTFLPRLPRLTNETQKDKVNVNVFLIDSLSRSHFYRSLPKTVDYLRKKNADPNFPAYLFEFELFQAVHGHTHENEHALFSGKLFPEEWTSKKRTARPVGLQVLYGIFKDEGYQTMFLDDLCWKAAYGIVSKVRSGSWSSLLKKMKKTNVDTRGMTEAACKILTEKGQHLLPFFDNKDHQLCFNGKHQHEYLFEYVVQYLEAIKTTPRSKPLFSYATSHVSHDEIGLRVQSIDRHLEDFIKAASLMRNTISFIFADHGNTYTSYQVKFLEGRQEMYHPAMLVVLPKRLARRFGRNAVSNLRTNQHRLFNMFDFRASLVALAKYDGRSNLDPVGLFGHISKERTCNDLNMTEEAICICRARKLVKLNLEEQFILSEFAIGELNNKIQDALLQSRGPGHSSSYFKGLPLLFGSCQRLRIQKISNIVQESKVEGYLATSMDVTVESGTIVDQEELITVQIESAVGRGTQSHSKMKLSSYNRISKYGPHEQCADHGVPLPLCVCNSDLPGSTSIQEILGENSHLSRHSLNSCVVEIRRYQDSSTAEIGIYELANVCDTQQIGVTITAENSIITSQDLPIFISLAPRTIYFVGVLRSSREKMDVKLMVT